MLNFLSDKLSLCCTHSAGFGPLELCDIILSRRAPIGPSSPFNNAQKVAGDECANFSAGASRRWSQERANVRGQIAPFDYVIITVSMLYSDAPFTITLLLDCASLFSPFVFYCEASIHSTALGSRRSSGCCCLCERLSLIHLPNNWSPMRAEWADEDNNHPLDSCIPSELIKYVIEWSGRECSRDVRVCASVCSGAGHAAPARWKRISCC